MPTADLFLPPRSIAVWRPARRTSLAGVVMGLLRRWVERARQRNALAGLDDRLLRDIGVTRVEAARECQKPFWR